MTRRELNEYSRGKTEVKSDGEVKVVFFKPSFVEVGIWEEWEKKGVNGR